MNDKPEFWDGFNYATTPQWHAFSIGNTNCIQLQVFGVVVYHYVNRKLFEQQIGNPWPDLMDKMMAQAAALLSERLRGGVGRP